LKLRKLKKVTGSLYKAKTEKLDIYSTNCRNKKPTIPNYTVEDHTVQLLVLEKL